MILHSITLPLELTNGNDGRGGRWFKSSKVRDDIEWMLRSFGHVRKPFDHQVRLRITRVIGKGQRLWDSDSIGRGNAKELIDALVAVGWFVDDGPKYITETLFRQMVPVQRGLPSVAVEVLTVDE